jgi:hypothetical protein
MYCSEDRLIRLARSLDQAWTCKASKNFSLINKNDKSFVLFQKEEEKTACMSEKKNTTEISQSVIITTLILAISHQPIVCPMDTGVFKWKWKLCV